MKGLLALMVCAGATSAIAGPANRRAASPLDSYRVVFLEAEPTSPVRQTSRGDAMVDAGRVAATRCPPRGCTKTIVKKRFRLRIDSTGPARFVRLSAFLQGDGGREQVRLDGRLLSSIPQVIAPSMAVRQAGAHTLEIEVPASEPPGPLDHTIVWLVEDAR